MSSKAKPNPQKTPPRSNSKLLGNSWDRVRDSVVLPVLRRQYIHLRNADYEHHAKLWLDSLRALSARNMRGPEAASVREMLQINLTNELARHRAVNRALDEVNITTQVSRVVQLLIELRQEVYRAVAAYYELRDRFFDGSMGCGQAHCCPYLAHSKVTDDLAKWFKNLQGRNIAALKDLPRYPNFPCEMP